MEPFNRSDPQDPLRRLEERLERASDAAERLVAEAAAEASATAARFAGRMKPPPAGWQSAEDPDEVGERRSGDDWRRRSGEDWERVVALLDAVRELIPTDLQRRLAEALRQLLLAIRALVDWYLERLEQRRAEPVEVQDIPVL